MQKIDGKVKWFSNKKGYGFLTGDDGKQYFAHYSKMIWDGFKELKEGEALRFEPSESTKGLEAIEIEKAEDFGYREFPGNNPPLPMDAKKIERA